MKTTDFNFQIILFKILENNNIPTKTQTMVKIEDENTVAQVQTHDDSTHDPYYLPIVKLPEVEVPNGEDDEEEIFKIRAKLFRFDATADPPEWKERGVYRYSVNFLKEYI